MQMFRDRTVHFLLFLNSSVQIALNWAEQVGFWELGWAGCTRMARAWCHSPNRVGIYMGWQPGLGFLGEEHLCQ